MLTRIEVDGFKNLVGFSADFGPFTCIAGPNAVGKSNLFDAIEFLSLLAEFPVKDAAKRVRGGADDVGALFWTGGGVRAETMTMKADMVLPATIRDERGAEIELSNNYVSYEVRLRHLPPDAQSVTGRIVVTTEAVLARSIDEFGERVRFPGCNTLVQIKASDDGSHAVQTHGTLSARAGSARTRLSTTLVASDDDALWHAIREELRSWRRFALHPDALRAPSSFAQYEDPLESDGSGLAGNIYRLAHADQDPDAVYAELGGWLSGLFPVKNLRVDRDDKRHQFSLEITSSRDGLLPASALSDGTLRFLALATLALDAKPGLICIDEVENGIHPAKVDDLVALLHRLVSATIEDTRDTKGIQQAIVSTHSPVVVRSVYETDPGDLLVAKAITHRGSCDVPTTTLCAMPLTNTWRVRDGDPAVGLAAITPYLSPQSV